MTLYLIGLGLSDATDITVKGLDAIKKCKHVFLENYTSRLSCSIESLEKFYGKNIILLEREGVEQEQKFLSLAKDSDVALLIIGDVFSATTHISIYKDALDKAIAVEVINNASVINAVGLTGLELYKFGKITSIPFDNKNVTTPYDVFEMNSKNGLHTLFLLDLKPKEEKFLSIKDAITYLKLSDKKRLIKKDTVFVGCARLGSKNFVIKSGTSSELEVFDFGFAPYCLIIPGKLHFVEEEALEMWNK